MNKLFSGRILLLPFLNISASQPDLKVKVKPAFACTDCTQGKVLLFRLKARLNGYSTVSLS